MINKSFTSILSFYFAFFQIIIYISEFLTSKEIRGYCPSQTNSTAILNNIINIGKEKFRYANFASYSNGDMVFLTTAYLGVNNKSPQKTRIFYGFKKNGRPLLNGSYFYSIEMNITNENNELNETNITKLNRNKYEGESLVIRESGNTTEKKEYLMSLSKKISYVEIYDFENEIIYKKDLTLFTNCTDQIYSYRHAFIPLLSNDSNYYYLLGFINTYFQMILIIIIY